jgi:3-hydroxypropanoate dehydrogenase
MTGKLDNQALDQLYRAARTRNAWTEQPVTEQQLRELYDLLKFGPTSGNCCPARFVWVRSAEGKHRLAALAAPTNAPKILAAPVTVIVGYDLDFAEQLPKLFPARGKDMQAYYSDPLVAQSTAFRNGSLQGVYLIIAARALGLDCGPRSLPWAPIASFFRMTTRTRIMPRAENSSIRYRSARAPVVRPRMATPRRFKTVDGSLSPSMP